MISREQAIEVARQHLIDDPLPHPHYKWVLKEPIQTDQGWLFEYTIECIKDIPPEQQEGFGGAPGFLVFGEGLIKKVGWSEWPRDQNWG